MSLKALPGSMAYSAQVLAHKTMARKSSIDALPADLRTAVNRKILDEGWTIAEVVKLIDDAGHEVSKSAVGRHKQKIDKLAERMKRSRETAQVLAREIGPDSLETQQGQVLVQLLQSVTFDHIANLDDDDAEGLTAKDLRSLAAAIKDTAQAGSINQARELKIREEVAKQNAEKLDEAVAEASSAGEKGLSADRIAQLRRDFLGVRDKA